jgi:uroporphyrinogen-III synthase
VRRVLVLRPEPGATATLERARERGLDAVAAPLFEIESLSWTLPEPNKFDGLLLTSSNAVRAGGEQLSHLKGLPVHAVGEATAEAARNAGFIVASTGETDVGRLLQSIDPALSLLHLCGEDRKEPAASQEILPIPVYRSRAREMVDLGQARDAVVLIHSPRAGTRFAELVQDRSSISIAAISLAAAEAVGNGWACVESADAPTDDALLALAARLCNIPLAQ